jgi:cbb3-type cytochrome oxidase subunit 3
MNPLIREAANSVQMGWLLALLTVLFFLSFVYWIWWAYTPSNRQAHEEAAELPFMDGDS